MVSLVSLLGLVHLRVAFSFPVLGGRCGVDDGCIYNGATLHHEASLLKARFDVIEESFTKMVLFTLPTCACLSNRNA